MRRRCGGPGGWPGGGPGGDVRGLKASLGMKITARGLTTPSPPPTHLSGEDLVPEQRTDLRPAAQPTRVSMWNRRLKGRPDVRQLGVMVQRPTLY
ncbi:unnamed protein product [Gadus morhua 'NCC']